MDTSRLRPRGVTEQEWERFEDLETNAPGQLSHEDETWLIALIRRLASAPAQPAPSATEREAYIKQVQKSTAAIVARNDGIDGTSRMFPSATETSAQDTRIATPAEILAKAPFDAIEGAAKLCESESRRWHDESGGPHWEQVAMRLNAFVLAGRVALELAAPPADAPSTTREAKP